MIARRLTSIAIPLLCGACFSGALQIHAQQAAAPAATAPLTVEDCIVRALKRNFDVQIQSYSLANTYDTLEISKASFDPTVSLSASRSFSQSAKSSTSLNGASNPTSDSGSYKLSVSKDVSTGGSVSVSTNLSRSSSNSSYSTFNPSFSGATTISVSQPLLKSFGRRIAYATIESNQIGINVAQLNFKTKVLSVVESTENAYYNYAYAREQETVRQSSLDLAIKLYEENKTKKTIGTVTDLDVLSAEVSVATARNTLLQAQQSTANYADALLALIGQFEFDQKLGAAKIGIFSGSVPNVDAVYARVLANQPDYLATKASIEQTKITLRVAKDSKRPDLSATGSLSYSGLNSDAGKTYADIPKGDSYNWSLGLTMSFPWGFRSSSASYRQALSNLRSAEAKLKQLEQSTLVEVRSAVRSVETNLESVKIAALSTTLSQRQYELEKARFDAGMSTARTLQQSRDDWDSARLSELKAQVSLQQAMVTLNRLQGSTLESYHIDLPKPTTQPAEEPAR